MLLTAVINADATDEFLHLSPLKAKMVAKKSASEAKKRAEKKTIEKKRVAAADAAEKVAEGVY